MNKNQNSIFFLIGITAIFVCWYFNLQHISMGGTLESFFKQNLVNPASASIFYDISLLFISISIWFYIESKRVGIKYWWAYIFIGLIIGISFSFPLFLIHRNHKLDSLQA